MENKDNMSKNAAEELTEKYVSDKLYNPEMNSTNTGKTRTRLGDKTNLLEMEAYNYMVQDVDKPNLFREFYEYVEIPKVGFNFRTSPYGMPEQVLIYV